jgi:hypothetical protein
MSKFSDEEREAILQQSFETLERLDETLAQPAQKGQLEDRLERWKREGDEIEERRAAQRDRRLGAKTKAVRKASTMDAETQAKWDAWLKAHVTRALADRDELWREVHAEVLVKERKATDAKLVKLRNDFEHRLDALRAELTKERALDDGAVVDLPALPLRKRHAAA